MVICQSTIGQVYTQCDANQNLCNTNSWQLCGTDDFLDRGGSSTPAPFGVEAWIGSWINHDPVLLSYQPPLTGNAPCTLPATIAPVVAAWACKGGSKLGHFQSYALVTSSQCYRVAQNQNLHEGFWFIKIPDRFLNAATCCQL